MKERAVPRPLIALTANTMRNIVHFRQPLRDAFARAGFDTVALAPDAVAEDGGNPTQWPIAMNRRGTNPVTDSLTIASYIKAFRRLGPVAVLGFTPKANIYGGLAARICGIPFLPNVSGLGTGFLKGGVIQRISLLLYRWAFARSSTVFFQNADDLEEFVQRGIVDQERSFLLPGSGINLRHFSVVPAASADALRLLFIGRFIADKGIRDLIEAIELLKAAGRQVELTLVGGVDPGNPTSIPMEEVARWTKSGLAVNAGEQQDVRRFIVDCDAIVLPSYREGLPRVLLEGGAMGRPSIATDVPGCREVVIDGVNGLLCSPHNPRSLMEAIERLMNMSREQRLEMGRAARRRVEDRFDEAQVVEQYRQALSRIGVVGRPV